MFEKPKNPSLDEKITKALKEYYELKNSLRRISTSEDILGISDPIKLQERLTEIADAYERFDEAASNLDKLTYDTFISEIPASEIMKSPDKKRLASLVMKQEISL